VSTIAPVAVGIALAFTWNMAGSRPQEAADRGSAVTPEVEMTVEQAAAQVWASASPLATAVSPRAPAGGVRSGTRSAGHAHRPGRPAASGCHLVRPRTPERAVRLRAVPVCTPRSHAPKRLATDS